MVHRRLGRRDLAARWAREDGEEDRIVFLVVEELANTCVAIVAAVLRTTRDVRATGIRKSVGLCSAPDRNGIPVGVEELWTLIVRGGHAPGTGAGGGCDLETTGEVVRVSFGRSHDDVRGLMMAAWRRGRGSLLRGGGW